MATGALCFLVLGEIVRNGHQVLVRGKSRQAPEERPTEILFVQLVGFIDASYGRKSAKDEEAIFDFNRCALEVRGGIRKWSKFPEKNQRT